MEFIILRIPHVSQQIFEQLDIKSLKDCREVTKSWQKSINRKNLIWLQNINIPSILRKGNTYLHIAAKTGHHEIFEIVFDNEVAKNPENPIFETLFYLACRNGFSKIAELILQKCNATNINFNQPDFITMDNNYLTPFQYALLYGASNLEKIIKQKSTEFKIKLIDGKTTFPMIFLKACEIGQKDIAKLLMKRSNELKINLNAQNMYSETAFLLACKNGHKEIVQGDY